MVRNSVELWRGASSFDGRPIVVIATGLRRGSRNAKTGAMIQTWILAADVDPVAAVKATPADLARIRSLPLRIGSYGDPGAVPVAVWQAVVSEGQRRTGYTHAWRQRPDLQGLCMASADSAAEHHVARAAGWRTFRVINTADDVDTGARPGEIECLAESRGKSCIDCGLCHGSGPKAAKASIFIAAHGAKASRVGLAILQ